MEVCEGRISHIRIPSRHLVQSIEFYSRLFDWSFTPNSERYILFRDPTGLEGGFTLDQEPAAGGVCLFLDVADLEAKLAEVAQAGGEVVQGRRPVGGPGFYALVRDPHGNLLGLYSET